MELVQKPFLFEEAAAAAAATVVAAVGGRRRNGWRAREGMGICVGWSGWHGPTHQTQCNAGLQAEEEEEEERERAQKKLPGDAVKCVIDASRVTQTVRRESRRRMERGIRRGDAGCARAE